MMRSLEEIDAEYDATEARLHALQAERRECQLAQSKYKIGDVLTFGHKSEEGKIVALECRYGAGAMPVVVLRKKDGSWGSREKRLYSWDLERRA